MNKNLNDISSYIQILQDMEDSPDTRVNDVTRLEICGWLEKSLKLLKSNYQEKVAVWDKKGLLKGKF